MFYAKVIKLRNFNLYLQEISKVLNYHKQFAMFRNVQHVLNKILIYVLNAKTAIIYMMKHRVGNVLINVKYVLIISNALLVTRVII